MHGVLTDHPLVGIAAQGGNAPVSQQAQAFRRSRPKEAQIPGEDEHIRAYPFDLVQNRFEGAQVTVNVGKDGDMHDTLPMDYMPAGPSSGNSATNPHPPRYIPPSTLIASPVA